jgi:hypothetical protein
MEPGGGKEWVNPVGFWGRSNWINDGLQEEQGRGKHQKWCQVLGRVAIRNGALKEHPGGIRD